MKVTLYMLKLLHVFLRDSTPKYGLELCQASGVNVGALYPILMRLEKENWLASEWEILSAESTRKRRRYYHLTDFGRSQAEKVIAERQGDINKITIGQRFHFWLDGVAKGLDELSQKSPKR